jgi:purine-binding chemotaxis protein CheW
MTNTYLSFTINKELYAVNVEKVLEVLERQEITSVPNVPEVIKGIVNFRGEIVPVFESRIKFNLPARDDNASFVIIVLDLLKDNENYRIGAIVDKVKDVITLSGTEIKQVPAMSKDFNADFLSGIVKRDNEFILLLDVNKVFTSSLVGELNLAELKV